MTSDLDCNALAVFGTGGMRAFSPCLSVAANQMGIDDMNACGRVATRGGGS